MTRKPLRSRVLTGDCEEVLKRLPTNTFDLVITSPPYADRRRSTYRGIHPDDFVDWFMSKTKELERVLRPKGTFILNIKEIVVNGERHTYVIDLIGEMRNRGWLWTEEYIWHKKNSYPGKWPNRFRDAWERCLQFNRQKQFAMYQKNVMEPIGDWAKKRLNNLSDADTKREKSEVGSGFGRRVANWVDRDKVYPTNVRRLATECGNVGHSAAFPVSLPHWFIRLFTQPGDVVLDPFCGSGTVGVAAKKLNRKYVLIDVEPKFVEVARKRIKNEGRTGGGRTGSD
jgi:DNA modification methylase